jgi:hypothetical protein
MNLYELPQSRRCAAVLCERVGVRTARRRGVRGAICRLLLSRRIWRLRGDVADRSHVQRDSRRRQWQRWCHVNDDDDWRWGQRTHRCTDRDCDWFNYVYELRITRGGGLKNRLSNRLAAARTRAPSFETVPRRRCIGSPASCRDWAARSLATRSRAAPRWSRESD